MKKENGHLPVYGVGPYYGGAIIAMTIIGIILSVTGTLESGIITGMILKFLLIGIGACLVVAGFLVWKPAALGKNSIDGYIESNTLCTTGIYRIVRNPCYSGIMLACTGAILMAHNLWLLILPVVYWLLMTVLMKCTEEKWLTQQYGQEYIDYCKRVHRCIPWFPGKK